MMNFKMCSNEKRSAVHVQRKPSSSQPIVDNGVAGVPRYLHNTVRTDQSNQMNLGTAIKQSSQGGQGLMPQSKTRFEPFFGADFSNIRIHNKPDHHALAKTLNANAFTMGDDVFFDEGRYRPGSQDGDKLLAHELTHVLQQRSGSVPAQSTDLGVNISQHGDNGEIEADKMAEQATRGDVAEMRTSHVTEASSSSASSTGNGTTIQRDENDSQGLNLDLLPPGLRLRLGGLGLLLGTTEAGLNYNFSGSAGLGLGYEYGEDFSLNASYGDLSSRLGINPDTGVGSAELKARLGDFNLGLTGNTEGAFGASIGYGAPLLPMPSVLRENANTAWGGFYPNLSPTSFVTANPLMKNLSRLNAQRDPSSARFGAGLSFNRGPADDWRIMAGIQGRF